MLVVPSVGFYLSMRELIRVIFLCFFYDLAALNEKREGKGGEKEEQTKLFLFVYVASSTAILREHYFSCFFFCVCWFYGCSALKGEGTQFFVFYVRLALTIRLCGYYY